MDKEDSIKIAKRYAICVGAKFDYVKFYLFGSYAKGNYNDDSDIDIAIIFKDYNNLIDMQLELMRLRRKIDSCIEPHPFRESEFELSNPIVNEIFNFGKEIKNNVV